MKIRTGFVSNSSSASFIVTVQAPKNKLLGLIAEECPYGLLSLSTYKEDLESRIANANEMIIKRTEQASEQFAEGVWPDKKYYEECVELERENLTRFMELQSRLGDTSLSREDILKDQLSFYNIEVDENMFGMTQFLEYKTMWNSVDDVSDRMKLIIAALTLIKVPLTVEVESDQ